MRAKDIMTTDVVTVPPEMTVADIAQVLIDHNISGVPVVDTAGGILGMVSEGDLLQQAGLRGEARRSWRLRLVSTPEQDATAFIKSHGGTAADIMTTKIIAITEGSPTATIARLLSENHIRRVPVLRDGELVGIVSRGNLLQALASQRQDGAQGRPTPMTGDRTPRCLRSAAKPGLGQP